MPHPSAAPKNTVLSAPQRASAVCAVPTCEPACPLHAPDVCADPTREPVRRAPRAAYYLRASAAFSGYFLKNKKENKKSSCKTECIVI